MRRALVVLLAIFALAPAGVAGAKVRPPGLSTPLGAEQLSDERRVTRWAYAIFQGTIRRDTWTSSAKVGRLRRLTEDLEPEIYLVLASRIDSEGATWLKVRIPGRPNGRTGWALRNNFSELTVVRERLLVNRRTLRATLYRGGNVIWTSRIGVGKPGTPTPAGRFYVRERLRNLNGDPLYGPWAFGTSAYSVLSDWPGGGVVGIHGTNQPQLIPGRPSHGCIRVPNRKIRQLVKLMPLGTPIRIL